MRRLPVVWGESCCEKTTYPKPGSLFPPPGEKSGLGSMNENLPGFITMTPASGFGGAQNYGSSFLPAHHQGTRLGTEKRPIADILDRIARLALPPPVVE
ncbi:DUF1501 domain-containing protein [Rubinisphaera italica]|uniref:DUF1501 domain-containing protein n=1 Tax=Rubinisphaera italica TaxID=2527969 RepID=UPI0011B35ED0|nr:DUF1501 domain-containing protein [Rubinisphaera italica]